MDRSAAVERVERLVETVESDPMPVPVREIWVYGEVSLGLDPIERLDVYLTKDILLGDDNGGDRSGEFEKRYGVKGIGQTIRSEWAAEFPEFVRANDNGYAAPEKCLAAHLTERDEPIHLEVCNASFEDNVTQRLQGARMRNDYEQILDPRGVCLWVDGRRSEEAFGKLRSGELVLPTLPEALEMLGMDEDEASEAAETLQAYRERQEGATVRGDVV
ncbi:hypothetical protein HAPAU_01110 [Halalkalicoccus paucihalophilus]|uniref:Uncharacterized protein n=1 Tax=Halalkalicoccus paucihalophilus TaxID=1008153 RepID=A0A151AIP2_9EURY|nr:hypothetical protein [Halalkalicoccus paucihalophilus]KYH27445.1 hypothetical protein HAPAU_01110 [Halalkalicoccus paucihalophilus]